MTRPRRYVAGFALLVLALACGGARPQAALPPAPKERSAPPPPPAADATDARGPEPVVAPPVAYASGLMPLTATGVTDFLRTHPTYDGRGVVIAILDSGIDARTPGLIVTSTGAPKVLDLRDFSGEGRVALHPVEPAADGSVMVAGRAMRGAGRVNRVAVRQQWFAGTFRELPLGDLPQADLNGNGANTDEYPLVVVRATDGWAVFLDTNLNGSFEDEMPLHDYRQGRETLTLGTEPITLAANVQEVSERPVLDLYLDTSAHGTHVAGIAAGHNLYDVAGFHGVAPGAQLLGLKIANNSRGGISVHGSMVRAMEYAARFARDRNLPLVLSLSFGVGNEREGRAVIDSLVDAFVAAHPDVVFAISAGNDGPGLSTIGFPGSADLALSVGATFPGVYMAASQPGRPPRPDVLGFWSARGGELAKPDLVAPGIAYSSVPRWDTGKEVKLGTSMSSPHVAGLAACLLSAMAQEGRRAAGADVAQALEMSARRLPGATVLDQGAGLPQLGAAYEWLVAGHQGSGYAVRTDRGASAAFRREGPGAPGDTLDVFHIVHRTGLRAAQFILRSDVPWLDAPDAVAADPRTTAIGVVRKPNAMSLPGTYVGSVLAFNPSDTLAGPLFRLTSTVVVPHDLESKGFVEDRREIPAGRVQRYFFRVGPAGSTFDASITLPDSGTQSAMLHLYEPSGQPFRGGGELSAGQEDGGTARFLVRSEDLVPGVYELDVVAPPTKTVVAIVRAQAGSVALAVAADGIEARGLARGTVHGRPEATLVGAERTFAVQGRGTPPETLLVRVPSWAADAEVDLRMTPEQWALFTDFAITVFDSTGRRVAGEPMDYAASRLSFTLDSTRAGSLVVELFPAYAWVDRTPAWRADVTVRFLLREGRPLARGAEVTVVPGGRLKVPIPDPGVLPLPDGFGPVVETSLGGAVRRVAPRVGR